VALLYLRTMIVRCDGAGCISEARTIIAGRAPPQKRGRQSTDWGADRSDE